MNKTVLQSNMDDKIRTAVETGGIDYATAWPGHASTPSSVHRFVPPSSLDLLSVPQLSLDLRKQPLVATCAPHLGRTPKLT